MKKWISVALTAVLLGCTILPGCGINKEEEEQLPEGKGIAAHGWLKVEGSTLLDEYGRQMVLRGMSSHGITWYPRFLNGHSMKTLSDYGANLFRLSMYTTPPGAYLEDPERSLDYLYMGIESALSQDLYTIVDWHILEDGNPNEYAEEAVAFFNEISKRYANEPGIIYEICNEPNGETDWDDVKKYADRVIPVIRSNSPNSVILVGTPNYCTNFDGVYKDPLEYPNIMYTMHRYIDIGEPIPCEPSQLPRLKEAGIPVFVSEWGITVGQQAYLSQETTDFSREVYPEAAQPFLDEMEQLGVSWAGWALGNKAEWHSAVSPGCDKLGGWTREDLTVSGRLMFDNFETREGEEDEKVSQMD